MAARHTVLLLCLVAMFGLYSSPHAAAQIDVDTSEDGLIPSPEPGWPQWRGPRRDGISDEKGLRKAWPEGGPPVEWQITGIGQGWSSPIVVDGRVFITGDIGDDLAIFAYDTQGNRLWKTTNGQAWKGSFPGARACCVYSEEQLYHLNAHGRLACLDAVTGEEQWSCNILERFEGKNITWALSECLLVDGPRVVVTPGGARGLMAALDKRNGDTRWICPPLGDDHTSHCSPILFRHNGRRLIASCSSGHGFGVDAETGRLLWSVPLKNQYSTNVATPIYGNGFIYYVTPYAELGRLYELKADAAGLAADHVWTCPLDTVTGTGVLVDGVLYAGGYRKSKWWFGIDWKEGATRAECKELTTGAPIYADDRLYVLDERGTVGLLALPAGRMEIVGRFSLVDKRIKDAWAHPVLLDGRLYLRYHDTLWCYDVQEPDA